MSRRPPAEPAQAPLRSMGPRRLLPWVALVLAASVLAVTSVTAQPKDGASGQVSAACLSATDYVAESVEFAWVDVSSGTDTGIVGAGSTTIPIGFDFRFYGQAHSVVTVSSNGYLTFSGAGEVETNEAIPSSALPNDLIAVFWDALDVPVGEGRVTYEVFGGEPDRRLVIQWSGVATTTGGDQGSFQVALGEYDGSIVLQYRDVSFGDPLHDGGASATIGVEDGTGTRGVQVWFDSAGLADGTAYRLRLPECASHPVGPWMRATKSAGFSSRDSSGGATFLDRIWLSGGYPHELVDLWSSSDGISWRKEFDETPYPAYSKLVTFNGRLWAFSDAVWSSSDGAEWTLVAPDLPFEYGPGFVVHDGRLWAFGYGREVWWTLDGASWFPATRNAEFGERIEASIAAFDGRLWLMGGATPAPGKGYSNPDGLGYPDLDMNNDVWTSTDGTNWTRVAEHAPWVGRMWSSSRAFAGRLWLMAGYDNDGYRNLGDTWFTYDGSKWETLPGGGGSSWAPRHYLTAWVFRDRLWIGAGNGWPLRNDVWSLVAQSPISTSTEIESTTSPAVGVLSVELVARVTPDNATGAVVFSDGAAVLGSAPLVSGMATLPVTLDAFGAHLLTATYHGDVRFAPSSSDPLTWDVPWGPSGLVATATTPDSVTLGWNPLDGAALFGIYRKDAGGELVLIGDTSSTSFVDTGLSPGGAYLYALRASNDRGETSELSVPDLATTAFYSDPVLVPGVTTVKAIHLTELRNVVNAVRQLAGLGSATFSDPDLASSFLIKRVHLTELRSALDAARSLLGLPTISYTDPTITSGITRIKAAHIQELRDGVR